MGPALPACTPGAGQYVQLSRLGPWPGAQPALGSMSPTCSAFGGYWVPGPCPVPLSPSLGRRIPSLPYGNSASIPLLKFPWGSRLPPAPPPPDCLL